MPTSEGLLVISWVATLAVLAMLSRSRWKFSLPDHWCLLLPFRVIGSIKATPLQACWPPHRDTARSSFTAICVILVVPLDLPPSFHPLSAITFFFTQEHVLPIIQLFKTTQIYHLLQFCRPQAWHGFHWAKLQVLIGLTPSGDPRKESFLCCSQLPEAAASSAPVLPLPSPKLTVLTWVILTPCLLSLFLSHHISSYTSVSLFQGPLW